jgi:hypothetical protein
MRGADLSCSGDGVGFWRGIVLRFTQAQIDGYLACNRKGTTSSSGRMTTGRAS